MTDIELVSLCLGVLAIVILYSRVMANQCHAPETSGRRIIDKSKVSETKLNKQSKVGYVVTVFGQAGKIKECIWFEKYHDAEKRMLKAFSRTPEDTLRITGEEADLIEFSRMHWSHRGRKEGNVVGNVKIAVEAHTPVK